MKQKNVILMVVAVGCGLAAAVLTSQMSGRGAQTETVEVIVAAKDLPVGTYLSKDEMKTAVKKKKLPKDGLPPAFVNDESELLEKRLSRGIRAEETFNPKDLTKGISVTLPPGMNMISLSIGVSQAVAGFVGPGARVDVLATLRLGNQLKAFPLMVNMLVIAVDTHTGYEESKGVFPNFSTVSFAVDRRQALLLALAKTRGCTLELMLRNQSTEKVDETYSIETVEKLLQDANDKANIYDSASPPDKNDGTPPKGGPTIASKEPKTEPKGTEPTVEVGPAAAPKGELVKVPVALKSFEPGTKLTPDLIDEQFTEKEFRKGDAVELALTVEDLKKLAADGKELKLGLGKGQFVTGEVVGDPTLKPTKRYTFNPSELPAEAPPAPVPTETRPRHVIHKHTPSGSVVITYEEVRPGQWRQVSERPLSVNATDFEPAPKGSPN